MKKLWHLFHYSVYRNMMIYFVLLIALTVTIVSSTLYMFFATKTEKLVSNNVISMLEQTSYTSGIIQDQILTIGNQLLSNNDIMNVLMDKHSNKLDERDAMYILRDIEAVFPIIKYIGIYNDNTKRYLNTAGFPYSSSDFVQKELIRGRQVAQYIEFFPQELTTPYENMPEDVLTFVLRPNYSTTTNYKGAGAIVIHVDENYIQQTIRSISSKSEHVFVMDAEGSILSHTDSKKFMDDFSAKPYIDRILSSEEKRGYFITSVDGRKQLVSYVKPSRLKFYFISVKPYNLIISDIYDLRNFTFVIALVMILIGVLLAFIATNRIYNPLGQLLSRIQSFSGNLSSSPKQNSDEYTLLSEAFSNVIDKSTVLEKELENSFHMFKKAYLDHAIKGTLYDFKDTHDIQTEIHQQFAGSHFMVILANIDRYADLSKNNTQKQLGMFRLSICNISQELLQKHVINDTIVVDEKTIAILAQPKGPEQSSHILLSLAEIQNVIREYFKLSVTFSIGNMVSDKYQIYHSYHSAQEYAKYRLFYGHESIIKEDMVQKRLEQNNHYPAATEKKLLEGLRLNQSKKISLAIEQFYKDISKMSYYQARTYSNQLLITIQMEFEGTFDIKNSKECLSIINQLQFKETLPDISSSIQDFCKIITFLLESKNVSKNNSVIESVCEYLQKNFNQPDLGVETMADKVQLSSGYLGKLFREYTQMSFNEYLKHIRLKKAKELLTQTDDPITVISKKVGIVNTNYFYLLFKKTYGLSPSVYREDQYSDDSTKTVDRKSRGVSGQ